jgi:hypothetical protein
LLVGRVAKQLGSIRPGACNARLSRDDFWLRYALDPESELITFSEEFKTLVPAPSGTFRGMENGNVVYVHL